MIITDFIPLSFISDQELSVSGAVSAGAVTSDNWLWCQWLLVCAGHNWSLALAPTAPTQTSFSPIIQLKQTIDITFTQLIQLVPLQFLASISSYRNYVSVIQNLDYCCKNVGSRLINVDCIEYIYS